MNLRKRIVRNHESSIAETMLATNPIKIPNALIINPIVSNALIFNNTIENFEKPCFSRSLRKTLP